MHARIRALHDPGHLSHVDYVSVSIVSKFTLRLSDMLLVY